MILEVEVTQADIDSALGARALYCPLMAALNREHWRQGPWSVGNESFYNHNHHLRGELPPEARRFADDFDHSRPLAPARFQLEVF